MSQQKPFQTPVSQTTPIRPSHLLAPLLVPPNHHVQRTDVRHHLLPIQQPRLPNLLWRSDSTLRKPHKIYFRIDILPADVFLLLKMTRTADGMVSQEDFVHQPVVPSRAGRAAGDVIFTRDHNLVFNCVTAFRDSGFCSAHISRLLRWRMTAISALIQGKKSGSSIAKLLNDMKEEDFSSMVEGSLFKSETRHYHHLSLLIQSSLFSPDHNFTKDVP